jgi:MGT family glycosyltransferase
MSRILAYTSPARGHLYPLVPILDELARRGHEVHVRTLADECPMLERRGFVATAIASDVTAVELDDWHSRNPQKGLAAAVRAFCARAPFDSVDLRDAIETSRPDAVVVDINSWGASAAAESWGGPVATFCPYPIALRSRDVPPYGPGIAPARGPIGRGRDALLRPVVLGAVERQMLPPLNSVRRGLGLAPLAHADEVFRRPPLVLYLTAEPFEYPRRDWPDSVVMVGPCAWEPPAEAPEWLAAVDVPIVLVTTSSEFQDDGRLVTTALQALADEPVHVVATLPSGDLRGITVPANAHVERFVAHGALLDRAVCAVTHGGMGATQKALAGGVPVVAVPFGRDQHEVARRVEVAGAGTRLPLRRLDADRLRAHVRDARRMTEGAGRVAQGFRDAGGPPAAADAIEQRLLTSTRAR